jgi:hypothetical protein
MGRNPSPRAANAASATVGAPGGNVEPTAVHVTGYGWRAVWEGGSLGFFESQAAAVRVADKRGKEASLSRSKRRNLNVEATGLTCRSPSPACADGGLCQARLREE